MSSLIRVTCLSRNFQSFQLCDGSKVTVKSDSVVAELKLSNNVVIIRHLFRYNEIPKHHCCFISVVISNFLDPDFLVVECSKKPKSHILLHCKKTYHFDHSLKAAVRLNTVSFKVIIFFKMFSLNSDYK